MLQDLIERVKKAKRVYIIGNGGSYANAAHIANDLVSVGIKAFTLDAATLTAFANDYGYERAFAHWLEKVGEEGDLLIALSGSGKSPNLLEAIRSAKQLGIDTHLVTDYLKTMDMQRSEERQVEVGHELMRAFL